IWLLQYAYHRSFNRRKYLAMRRFYDGSPTTALAHLEVSGERSGREGMNPQEWQEDLRRGMEEIKNKERKIVGVVGVDERTGREASEQMHESYANGRNYYYRALKKLRDFLGPANSGAPQERNNARS